MATAFGSLKDVRDALSPGMPLVPSVMSSLPSGLNLYTTWASGSVAHKEPSGSKCTLWASVNNPASPHCLNGCPSREKTRKYGAARTSTTTEPFPSAATDDVLASKVCPEGSCAHLFVTLYRSKRLTSVDCAEALATRTPSSSAHERLFFMGPL